MNIDTYCINKANQYKFYKQRTSSTNRDFEAYSFKTANDHHLKQAYRNSRSVSEVSSKQRKA